MERSSVKTLTEFEAKLLVFIEKEMVTDPAHDLSHINRVVKTAKTLCAKENGNDWVVLPAAYLHDCFSFPKNHPERSTSSQLAADKALEFLEDINYPQDYFENIHHAVIAHSYSAAIPATTLEAKIVQDADRLDSLGAIGVARCILVSSSFGGKLYSELDPFCEKRSPEEMKFTVDHFFTKLFSISETMQTESAKIEAKKRRAFMETFLEQLSLEVS